MPLKLFRFILSNPMPWALKLSIIFVALDVCTYFVMCLLVLNMPVWGIYFKSHIPIMLGFVMPTYGDELSFFDLFLCWLNSVLIGFVLGLCVDVFLFLKKRRMGSS